MAGSFLARRYRRDLAGLAIFALAILAAGLGIGRSYYLTMLIYAGIDAIAALGMCVLFGLAGQISIGQAAFFGIGAYGGSLLVMRAGMPPVLATLAGTLLAAGLGWLISRPLLRLATNYLAMATLAFGVICYVIFAQLRSVTGGIDPGLSGVPPFSVLGFGFAETRPTFWLVAGLLWLATLSTVNLVHGRNGRALQALKGSEIAAGGAGIDVVRAKVAAFTLAAALAGLAGALFGFVQGAFNATVFNVDLSIELLLMVVVGSVDSPWGALFGALFVTLAPALLEDFEQYKLLIYGVVLTLVMIFLPDGLGRGIGSLVRSLNRLVRPA